MSQDRLEERIDALEVKVAYQDDAIHTLSEELYKQQKELEQVLTQNRLLKEKLRELQDAMPVPQGHEVPPHY